MKRDCSQPYLREQAVAEQIAAALRAVALPADWTDWMLEQLQTDERAESSASSARADAIEQRLRLIDEKVTRLTDAYLEHALSLEEYRGAKNKLMEEKQVLKDRRVAFDQINAKRFEPVKRFLNALKTTGIVASGEDRALQCQTLTKVGSNLKIEDRLLRITLRGAWQLVADHGPFAQNERGAPMTGAPSVVDMDHLPKMRRR